MDENPMDPSQIPPPLPEPSQAPLPETPAPNLARL